MKKTLIVGIGSILRRDDGVGIRVIEELEKEKLPEHVKLQSGDLSGLDLLKFFPGFKKAVIIDAANMQKSSGSINIFNPAEIKKSSFDDKFSTHGIALLETLTLAEKLDIRCKIIIIGIQPYDTSFKVGLTEPMEKKIPSIIDKIKVAIEQ